MFRRLPVVLCALLVTVPLLVCAGEPVDLDMVNRIRVEGLHHSQVSELLEHLTEVVGPRLTGSPALREAAGWARDTMAGWGLVNAHLDERPFGRGWTFSRCEVDLVTPRQAPLLAYPVAWTPGTGGTVRGRVVRANLASEDDLDAQRGKLAGAVVLLDEPRALEPPKEAPFHRYGADELADMRQLDLGDRHHGNWRERARKELAFRPLLAEFLRSEGVLATVKLSPHDGGLVQVTGSHAWHDGDDPGVTQLVMAAEHYNTLSRLLELGEPVELELTVDARFVDGAQGIDTLAEIQGADLADQAVMAGAHLDSWHAGTGATDNAASCAVVMEAMRILKALSVKPRRTIRAALWDGEEQGYLGSSAWVADHLARRPEPTDPEQAALPAFLRTERGPLKLEPEHATLSAYFNLDYGAGRIRGIYTQENAAVAPIFAAWLAPFADLGAVTVSPAAVGGTDHVPFDQVGIPAFQFIQDPLDYMARTHHTEMDVFDRVQQDDLRQAAVILASFLYDTAMRDEPLPRKPMPREEEK